jgi:hypothetical protein
VREVISSTVGMLMELMSLTLFQWLTGSILTCLTALSNLQFLTISHTMSSAIPESLESAYYLQNLRNTKDFSIPVGQVFFQSAGLHGITKE